MLFDNKERKSYYPKLRYLVGRLLKIRSKSLFWLLRQEVTRL